MVDHLLDAGVSVRSVQRRGGALAGKTFVLTGTLMGLSREEAKRRIERAGGRVSSSVSSATDYLVLGGKPGSKHASAKKLGIPILHEEDFRTLLG